MIQLILEFLFYIRYMSPEFDFDAFESGRGSLPTSSTVQDSVFTIVDGSRDDDASLVFDVVVEAPLAKASRRIARGCTAWHRVTSSYPLGPSSVADLADWPQYISLRLFGGRFRRALLQRTVAIVEDGLVIHSAYSGREGHETGLRMLFEHWKIFGVQQGLLFWASTEKNVILLKK